MAILISCKCGKKLRVKDELAGKKVKCPGCAGLLSVPQPEPEEEEPVPTLEAEEAPEPEESRPARKQAEPCWLHSGLYDNAVALDDNALYVASLGDDEVEKAKEALEDGKPVRKVLREKGKVIPLDDIQKVETDLNTAFIDVTWKSPGAIEATETNIHCESKEARDEIIDALKERLGEDWDEQTVEFSRLRAAALPLYTGAILLFLCFCLYMIATGQDRGGGGGGGLLDLKQVIFLVLLYVFGATGTLIIAVIITALVFVWLYFRVRTPPVMLTLSPYKGGRKKRRRD